LFMILIISHINNINSDDIYVNKYYQKSHINNINILEY